MPNIQRVLFPQLGAFPLSQQHAALQAARREPFDVIELLGIAFGLVLAASGTRYVLFEPGIGERIVAIVINFAIALPLLTVLVGPFWVRRVRRGLDAQLRQKRAV